VPQAPISEVRPAVVAAPTAKSRRVARAPFVVCIDDERQVREGMAALLGSWGCQTALGASAEDVLDSVAQSGRSPDLLLIDLHLGQGQADGLSTITRLRQDWGEDLPAALITAERDPATLNAARGQRVDVLLKPVKPAQLRALIAQRAASAE